MRTLLSSSDCRGFPVEYGSWLWGRREAPGQADSGDDCQVPREHEQPWRDVDLAPVRMSRHGRRSDGGSEGSRVMSSVPCGCLRARRSPTLNKGSLVLRPTSRLRAASGPANYRELQTAALGGLKMGGIASLS